MKRVHHGSDYKENVFCGACIGEFTEYLQPGAEAGAEVTGTGGGLCVALAQSL